MIFPVLKYSLILLSNTHFSVPAHAFLTQDTAELQRELLMKVAGLHRSTPDYKHSSFPQNSKDTHTHSGVPGAIIQKPSSTSVEPHTNENPHTSGPDTPQILIEANLSPYGISVLVNGKEVKYIKVEEISNSFFNPVPFMYITCFLLYAISPHAMIQVTV